LKDTITDKDISCLDKVTSELQKMRSERTLSLHAFLVTYTNIISFISYLQEDVMSFSPGKNYECLSVSGKFHTRYEYSDIIDNMHSNDKTVPFLSARDAYGINTFLFLYFNGISPVGVTLNPWSVHDGAFFNRSRDIISHDFQHIRYSNGFYEHPEYEKMRRVYMYILNNQDKIGPPGKVKGMIVYLFYLIHEIGGLEDYGDDDGNIDVNDERITGGMMEAILDNGLTDILPFIIDNDYYTCECLGYDEDFFEEEIKVKYNELINDNNQTREYNEEGAEDYVNNFIYELGIDFDKLYKSVA